LVGLTSAGDAALQQCIITVHLGTRKYV